MTSVPEDLSNVVEQGCQYDLVVGSRPLSSSRGLERVREFTDLTAVAHVVEAREHCQNLFGSPTLSTQVLHRLMVGIGAPDLAVQRTCSDSAPGDHCPPPWPDSRRPWGHTSFRTTEMLGR